MQVTFVLSVLPRIFQMVQVAVYLIFGTNYNKLNYHYYLNCFPLDLRQQG